MQLDILTPDKKVFAGEASLVQLPGIDGSFEILNNHAPLISALGKGRLKVIDQQNNTNFYTISGGVVEVQKNKVVILAESAEASE